MECLLCAGHCGEGCAFSREQSRVPVLKRLDSCRHKRGKHTAHQAELSALEEGKERSAGPQGQAGEGAAVLCGLIRKDFSVKCYLRRDPGEGRRASVLGGGQGLPHWGCPFGALKELPRERGSGHRGRKVGERGGEGRGWAVLLAMGGMHSL